ncbi:MAG: allantoicase [Rhodospirillaceae bacterium]|nr:allantoicase [Rhodospirillaceae bacterium]
MLKTDEMPDFARNAINLASAGLGARAVSATDEFFAPLLRMLQDSNPVFITNKYDDHGKWMDGWESRRRRGGGHDHAIIALAVPGTINGFDVDTSFFTGNHPPECRIEACRSEGDPNDDTAWTELVPMQDLNPDSHHFLPCDNGNVWSHLRFHIHPDGGVARLRVFGIPYLDPASIEGRDIDLLATLNGGRIVAYSDAHYGTYHRLLAPGRGQNMGDGWETRRRRGPGHDWIILALGVRGAVSRAIVDTAHFKGNYPDSCSIQAVDLGMIGVNIGDAAIGGSEDWPSMLSHQKLSADTVHDFLGNQIEDLGPITHVRLNIFPDGGVSRLRLYGRAA